MIHYSEDAEGIGVKDPVPEKKESIRKKIARCIESSIKSQCRQNIDRKTENFRKFIKQKKCCFSFVLPCFFIDI